MVDKARQHIVPRFYIALFNSDGAKVYVKTRSSGDVELKSPKWQGYEEDAFTVVNGGERDTSCDNANNAVENWCAPHLAQLVSALTPTDDQWRAIFILTANLISRSRWTRDHNAWLIERVQKVLPKAIEVLKDLPPLPEAVRHLGLSPAELDDRPEVLARGVEIQYPLTAALGAVPIADELKTGKDCDLLVAPAGSTFITSDEPALILDGGMPVLMTLAPGFLAHSEVEVYLPLKPDLACLWSRKSSRATRAITKEEIAGYNRMIWENRYERAFAAHESDLDQF